MAKFCTKCGKKLEDGKACDCAKEKNVTSKKEEVVTTSNANDIINSLIEIVKGIFVKPIDTIRKYTDDNNMTLGIILMAINSLITGFMVYFLAKESMGLVSSMMGYGSLYSLSGMNVEVPFMKVVGFTFLIMAVYFVVLAFVSYLVANKLFKADTSWKKAIASIGVCSALTSVTTIVAIVCIYISMTVFAIVIALGALLFLGYYYHSIKISSDIDENKQGYTFICAVAAALFVSVYVLPKIFF